MTNFCVRKLDNKFYVSFQNNQIYVYNNDGIIFNFPEDFYSINSDISFDFRIDSTAKANLMEVAQNYGPSRMLYDPEKFLAPTILTDEQIIARGQNPLGWKQTYSPVELTISYKINNIVQKYGPHNVEARVKGFGSFLPYNRKMPLRVKSSSSIGGLGLATDLTINNMIQSPAKITEHIIYKIYRDYGMLAPRTNFIRVFINDSTTKITSVTNNTITTNSNHYLFPGMRVKFVGLGNISNDSIFYVMSSGKTDTSFKVSDVLNGTEYTLPTLSSVEVEFYTDYGEYTNVENLKNLYKINEFFGTNNTTGLYELGVTTSNQELNVPSSDLYYSREYGSSRSTIDNFLTALASTSNWYTNFSNYANINQFIKFAVIELLLGQMDGYNTFLNNSYLAADNNNKFHVIPWGSDSYCSEDALNALGWFAYGRFLQQCWANNTTLTQFATELVAFNNWLKNDSNIINYINTIFDQKIDTFNSDIKQPISTTSSTITSAKNNLISFIQNSDDRVDYFLGRPRPVTNLNGQLVNGNFVMNWDPVTTNVSSQSISNITYEIIFLASTDHKYRYGGYSSSNTSHGMTTTNTTYTVSSGNMDSLYAILQSEMSDISNLFEGLYFSVVPKGVNDLWGFAAQPILARSSTVTPPGDTPYVPTMKIGITEVMSNSTAKYGLSSAPDWFEITNFDTSGINISGWKMDDDSKSIDYAVSIIPSGWTSLGSGESAVFIETNNPAVAIPAFRQFWSLPSTTKIGYYFGSAVSFSSNGDGTHLFVPSGSSQNSWVYFTGVSFGKAITNRSFYWEYNSNDKSVTNTGITNIRVVGPPIGEAGERGGYRGSGQGIVATGSPGIYYRDYAPTMQIGITEAMPSHGLRYGTISEGWVNGYLENTDYNPNGPDWFEITNFDTSSVNISGLHIYGMVHGPMTSPTTDRIPLIPSGWTTLDPGESAVFINVAPYSLREPQHTEAGTIISYYSGLKDKILSNFRSSWKLDQSVKLGYYNMVTSDYGPTYDGIGSSLDLILRAPSGSPPSNYYSVPITGVSFGVAKTGTSFYWEYDNFGNIIGTGYSSACEKESYNVLETVWALPNNSWFTVDISGNPHPEPGYEVGFDNIKRNAWATGSPGIYNTGTNGIVTTTYTCFNLTDPTHVSLEPWDPGHCNNDKTHTMTLSKNNYLATQRIDPPSYATELLCNSNYSVSISNKIKITIDDPVFSGTYVFDYGNGSTWLTAGGWIFNSGESTHNLRTYDHDDYGGVYRNLTLARLAETTENLLYKGYLELKTSYYNDQNNTSAIILEDAFAFPATLVFTAVQPPCPCTGDNLFGDFGTSNMGSRLSVGIALPIRWRHPYRNWVVVDRATHTINHSINNYISGSPFNDGRAFNDPSNSYNPTYLNNSIYIKNTESYVPGTANTEIGPGFISIYNYDYENLASPICTGVSDLGFAFRVDGSTLGHIDSIGRPYVPDNVTIQGLGSLQTYDRWQNFYGDWIDDRQYFDNKIPVKATWDFVYSCRAGLPCSFVDTPTSVSTTTGILTNYCWPSYNFIGTDFLCGQNEQVAPPDSVWINNSITSTDIIYSGYSGSPFINSDATYTYRILPVQITGQLFNGKVVDIYDFNPSTINSNILIRSTGGLPSDIRNFLQSNLFVCDVTTNNNDPTSSPVVTRTEYNKWDLYWSIDSGSNTAKVYIIPDTEYISAPTIVITGAGSSEVNGIYTYSHNGGYDYTRDSTDQYGHIFSKRTGYSWYRIALSSTGVYPYRWKIQKYFNDIYERHWVDFYANTGVYSGIIPYTNNQKIGTVNNQWYTDERCYLGANPPPTSITYYHR